MAGEFVSAETYISASFKLIACDQDGLAALNVNSYLLSENDPNNLALRPATLIGIYSVAEGRHLLLGYRVDPNIPDKPLRDRVKSLEIPRRIMTGPLEEVDVDLREATRNLANFYMPSRLLVMGEDDVSVLYSVRGVDPESALLQIKNGLDYIKVSEN